MVLIRSRFALIYLDKSIKSVNILHQTISYKGIILNNELTQQLISHPVIRIEIAGELSIESAQSIHLSYQFLA